MAQKINIQRACASPKLPSSRELRIWAQTACEGPCEITLRIVGEAEAQALNHGFRGKAHATNVLTFDYAKAPVVMADVVICAAVVAREALEQGKNLEAHVAHMVVHGVLHAQGYDHETSERDAEEMEALEVLLMGVLGFDNPYQA
jgi:probable rRNA maturation factor